MTTQKYTSGGELVLTIQEVNGENRKKRWSLESLDFLG